LAGLLGRKGNNNLTQQKIRFRFPENGRRWLVLVLCSVLIVVFCVGILYRDKTILRGIKLSKYSNTARYTEVVSVRQSSDKINGFSKRDGSGVTQLFFDLFQSIEAKRNFFCHSFPRSKVKFSDRNRTTEKTELGNTIVNYFRHKLAFINLCWSTPCVDYYELNTAPKHFFCIRCPSTVDKATLDCQPRTKLKIHGFPIISACSLIAPLISAIALEVVVEASARLSKCPAWT
jgi:hypothetical protein